MGQFGPQSEVLDKIKRRRHATFKERIEQEEQGGGRVRPTSFAVECMGWRWMQRVAFGPWGPVLLLFFGLVDTN